MTGYAEAISRDRRWDVALTVVHVVLFGALCLLLWKLKVTGVGTIFAALVGYAVVVYLLAILRKKVDERHERWLLEHGVSVTAMVSTVFARGQPDPTSSDLWPYVVLAVGPDPVTQEPRKYEFLTERPLYFRRGTMLNVKVNPRKTSDYTLGQD